MAQVLIGYYTRTQHTEHMAKSVAEGAAQVDGVQTDVRAVGGIEARELVDYDAIILGSPTYYGTMAAEVKQLLDESVAFHGQLAGKVGGAFASSANVGGGNETTVVDILRALLIHGMIIQGDPGGDHYGPVAVGAPDERARRECVKFGKLLASLAVSLHGGREDT
ncbi:MAG: NAD(P)H-dependent oxidoreductase [Phycisphaerae bacterium]|nr:NAD(P)H-dependent oxidoreductase [Phycisphaerae bacterium]